MGQPHDQPGGGQIQDREDEVAGHSVEALNCGPSATNPAIQPASRPRCSRQANASGERRPGAPEDHVGAEGHDQRRGQAGMATDHSGTEQLAAAGLFLGAGAPYDGEDAEQPDHDENKTRSLSDQLAEAGAEQAA